MEKYEFNVEKTTKELIQWIKDTFKEKNQTNAVVGISGGKDSSVVAALCVEALGKEHVWGIKMPNGVQKDIEFSNKLIEFLGIKYDEVNIGGAYKMIGGQLPGFNKSAQASINLAPRLRMSVLFGYAQLDSVKGFVANTCNLSEDFVGFSTLFGDSTGCFAPIQLLTTDEVIAIGEYLKLPEELTKKVPSDGLTGLSDEEKFGFTYAEVNDMLRKGIKGPNFDTIIEKYKNGKFKLEMININKFDPKLPVFFMD